MRNFYNRVVIVIYYFSGNFIDFTSQQMHKSGASYYVMNSLVVSDLRHFQTNL